MNSFIKNFLSFSAVLGVCFGAYIFLTDKMDKAAADVKEELRIEMRERDVQSDKDMHEIKSTIRETAGTVMQKLEKMDDRIDRVYQLQRIQIRESKNFSQDKFMTGVRYGILGKAVGWN